MSLEEIERQLEELRASNVELSRKITREHNEATTQSNVTAVNRVAVKLPPFWADRPSLWFSQAESQFVISGITSDETKFHYVVAQLDTRYATEVEDIITNPPETDKYKVLRTQLIQRLSASEEQRVRQLVSDEELGDRKPSQFLRHLRSLAGSSTLQDNLLRQLWLRRLPPHTQAILTTQLELSLDKLAELADKIIEVAQPPVPMSAAVNSTPPDSGNTLLDALRSLSDQIAELSANFGRNNRSHSHPRSRSMSRHRMEETKSERICWYHTKFGKNATKCIPPCAFQENSSSSQ